MDVELVNNNIDAMQYGRLPPVIYRYLRTYLGSMGLGRAARSENPELTPKAPMAERWDARVRHSALNRCAARQDKVRAV
jgi:hypothetical protein